MLPNYSRIVKEYIGDREEITALDLRCDLDRMLYDAYMAGMKDAFEANSAGRAHEIAA